MCGGDGFTQSTFDGLSHFCPVYSGSFEESYLIGVFLFSKGTFFFSHNFVLFTILLSIFLREITRKLSLLAVTFHMVCNVNFLFPEVATYARM